MHRIVKAHLENFVKSFGFDADSEALQFEKFSNYSVVSSRFSCSYEADNITTSTDDDGVDGIAIVIDEEVITSPEDVKEIFSTSRRNHDVDIIFIQAKRSENFDLGDFLKFKEGVLRFITQSKSLAQDEVLQNARVIFDIVMKEVPKIRNGRPSLVARFVTTGVYKKPPALEVAKKEFLVQLDDLGLFASNDVKFIGRDELTSMWVGTYSGVETSLTLFSNAALPSISGIKEAYLAVVRAIDFVNNLLLTSDGNLRTQVFEENVRSFLGMDNAVNKSISSTISSSQSSSLFPVLNNGITIVSPDVQLQGNIMHIKNFQIVNGCQTSNVLFEHRTSLGDLMVNIKVVETENEDVRSEIVKATNSQTKIEGNQFLSLRPVIKRVEQFFNTYTSDGKLYFERRDRQYVGQGIPATRIFSLHDATRCVASMYCNRPELASRYPKSIYTELGDKLFSEDTKEIVYYASCLTMYRFLLLVSNSTIPQNMKRFKWHIMALVRASICGMPTPALNSHQAEKSAKDVIDVVQQHGPKATAVFNEVVDVIKSIGDVSADRLKRQAILQDMYSRLK